MSVWRTSLCSFDYSKIKGEKERNNFFPPLWHSTEHSCPKKWRLNFIQQYTTLFIKTHTRAPTKSKSERPWYITEHEDKNIKEWSLRKQTQRSSTGSIFQLVTVKLQSQLGLLRLQRKGYIWHWPIKAKYWAEKERWVNIIHNFKMFVSKRRTFMRCEISETMSWVLDVILQAWLGEGVMCDMFL